MAIQWEKVVAPLATGEAVKAIAPVIISASRATDIPAFYSEWLANRLAAGYAAWIHPFTGRKSYVSFARTRLLVFWSKNPQPLLARLARIETLGFRQYYFQYTLNDYEIERLEPQVPPLQHRIETLREIAKRIGPEKVIWRFDPLLLGGGVTPKILADRIRRIRDGVAGSTRRLVISFLDLARYRSVQQNVTRAKMNIRELTHDDRLELATAIGAIAREGGLSVGSCAEAIDLASWGIEHNRCIDDRLMTRCFGDDRALMSFLGVPPRAAGGVEPGTTTEAVRNVKDAGQRTTCQCVASKDIGRYHTCPHQCVYCYANGITAGIQTSRRRHDPAADLI